MNPIDQLFKELHPDKPPLNKELSSFLCDLEISTVLNLSRIKVANLIKKIEASPINYSQIVSHYWDTFIKTARKTWSNLKRAKDPSWDAFFDVKFTAFLSDFYTIEFFPKKLSWGDYLYTEFRDFKKEYKKVITNQKKFIKQAFTEIAILSEFVDSVLSQIRSRKTLTPSEIEQRKIQLQHLTSLNDNYTQFNLIQVADEGRVLNFDSSWLDDVGGSLDGLLTFLENSDLSNLVPWSELEILSQMLSFWKFIAQKQLS
jgi:hypothetical protein